MGHERLSWGAHTFEIWLQNGGGTVRGLARWVVVTHWAWLMSAQKGASKDLRLCSIESCEVLGLTDLALKLLKLLEEDCGIVQLVRILQWLLLQRLFLAWFDIKLELRDLYHMILASIIFLGFKKISKGMNNSYLLSKGLVLSCELSDLIFEGLKLLLSFDSEAVGADAILHEPIR